MAIDKVSIRGIKNINDLDMEFEFPDSNIIVITGKNGIGKTTIIKAFHLISDPDIFAKSSGEDALGSNSIVSFSLEGIAPFGFYYNETLNAFDTKDVLPQENTIVSELPIPYGSRFQQFAKIANFDSELKANIASSNYCSATDLIDFLSNVYSSRKFDKLSATTIQKTEFYFILKNNDYYVREDHLSSGEFFLIQLFRIINSGAKLILIDELDVALDAVAQVNLYSAIKPILHKKKSRLIIISHSLAFMETVDDGGLYYLEDSSETVSLEQRSFGYIKSDLFGFRGFDRYILTEDDTLEGFIEYLIRHYAMECHYRHITIGVGGFTQLERLIKKNDSEQIFAHHSNVMCIVDGDVFQKISESYRGPTKITSSNIQDLELYIYKNRDHLLPDIARPSYQESYKEKKASKAYWKWLTIDNDISTDELYKCIVESKNEEIMQLKNKIASFLAKQSLRDEESYAGPLPS
ncbi:ATP-dependent nuclease [Endothiovibrio diazotrophicus]